MRCSSRSTTWLGRALPGALIGLLMQPTAMAAGRQAAGLEASAVRHAVAEAVKARMGQDADVHIEELDFRTTPPPEGASLAATLESGARLGRQARFSLRWLPPSGARPLPVAAGFALAKVQVEVSHLRAGRDIARGEACAEGDLAEARGNVGPVLIQKLPALADVAGARALRPLSAGDVVTPTAVQVRPDVVSGDVVAVRASVAGVTVRGRAVAQQSGSRGDIIRVVNRESRRPLRARVVGHGEVEVVQ
jgi:flagella basal body P-ring formation protein FlgA